MSIRRIAILVTLAAAACAAAVVPARAAKPYRAEHYHTRVVVEPGRSIAVTETIRFIFGQDEFTYVYRELPSRRMDGPPTLTWAPASARLSVRHQPPASAAASSATAHQPSAMLSSSACATGGARSCGRT